MMGSMYYSPFHWLAGLVLFLVLVVPVVKILQKAGYSGWWVVLWFIPFVNLVMLWVFAFVRWPVEERAAGR